MAQILRSNFEMPALHELLPVAPEVVDNYRVLDVEASREVVGVIATAGIARTLNGSRSLSVRQLPDGGQFVTRNYSRAGVARIEDTVGLDFEVAWDVMHEMYGRAEIGIVPSFAVRRERGAQQGEGLTVVSVYLPTVTPLRLANEGLKCTLAERLGRLMHDPRRYAPALESLRPDMFHATDSTDQADILLTDVDPFVMSTLVPYANRSGAAYFRDLIQSKYIQKIGDMIWDKWCAGDEESREDMTRSFVLGLGGGGLLDNSARYPETFEAFNEMVSRGSGMRNGIEARAADLAARTLPVA